MVISLVCFSISLVVVKPLAGLSAEPSGLHIRSQQRAGPVLGVIEPVVQGLHDGQTGVQPDEIGQGQGAHGMIHAKLHHRHGIHEMHADHLIRPLGAGRDPADGDGGIDILLDATFNQNRETTPEKEMKAFLA